MADALCGPSNALQNFQKHSTVDRTLQQDRLTNRNSPAQNFRSSPGPNAGILDPEFEAFQAGHGPPPPAFHQPPPQFAPLQHPQFAQAPVADWAADFQRLNIAPSHLAPIHSSNRPTTWHQEFVRQQSPAVQSPIHDHSTFGGIPHRAMGGYTSFQHNASFGGQGQQQAQEAVPAFDEAAFERAFAQAQQDMMEEASAHLHEPVPTSSRPEEVDPVMIRIREKRLPVYSAIKLRTEVDLGRFSEALPWLEDMESLEHSGKLTTDPSEARWCVDALQKIIDRDAPQDVRTRAEQLVRAINQRLMSTYPLLESQAPSTQESVWEDLAAAGYTTRSPMPERAEQQPEKEQQNAPINDDDEMAQTAGRLLERVADNTSQKFQNSQFLELMRRLRDREVRVDGDKVVEVSSVQSSSSPSEPTTVPIPEIDPKILDSAHVDFGMVMDSGHEYGLSRSSTNEPRTDEVSDQFGYYNVNSTYHR
ncbi:hypothetical protein EJ04DRAFT_554904 [Polyplosphaeria fusca]|uniref:Uncharacterized protein n=1 Tax=Polyplosphaeria fusca TaxID=682080 RepID=A0A9P4UWK7_9PLEO|nr:hypothetical protein EJ04DRAFT_554904 [Polyplosphaeria fusca]